MRHKEGRKPATFLLRGRFSYFSNYTNSTKSCKASYLDIRHYVWALLINLSKEFDCLPYERLYRLCKDILWVIPKALFSDHFYFDISLWCYFS